MIDNGLKLAQDLLDGMVGYGLSKVELRHREFVTMHFEREFGEELQKVLRFGKLYRGKWQLKMGGTAWRIDRDGGPVIGSGDNRRCLESGFEFMKNKRLVRSYITNDLFDMKLEFEGGLELISFAMAMNDIKQWKLFTTEQKIFTAGPGSDWSYERDVGMVDW